MYGCVSHNRAVYRYSTKTVKGRGVCKAYEIREEVVLPFLMDELSKQLKQLDSLVTKPPSEVARPWETMTDDVEQLVQRKDELIAQVSLAEENLIFTKDSRTRASLDGKITKMRDEIDEIHDRLDADDRKKTWTKDELKKLTDWWDEFLGSTVSVPVHGNASLFSRTFYQDPESDSAALLVHRRVINEALSQLGTELRLRWSTERVALRTGKPQDRHTLASGRLRLGQAERVHNPQVAEASSCPANVFAG